MIALLPQTEQRHRNANAEAGATQSQRASGCFIGGTPLVAQMWLEHLDRSRGTFDIPHCRVSIPKFAHHPASLNVEEILPDGVLFSQHWEDLTWALSKPAWGDSGDLVWQRREKPAARS
jgi:hypothetical protein